MIPSAGKGAEPGQHSDGDARQEEGLATEEH